MGVLLDREGELEALGTLIEDASAGRGRLALVEGEPGIGKTALLGAAAELAADAGALAVEARGAELEREFGFGVVRQLLERQVAGSPESLKGAAAHSAPALGAGEVSPTAGSDGFFAALHGLYWLVEGLASSRPLALLVDDAHWADEESLRFLAYLAGRLEGLPTLLVLGTRSGRAVSERPVLAGLANAGSAHSLRPSALSRGAVAKAVHDALGSEPAKEFTD
ncbi:MAG TPA: ATP-binding protein, partial [Thermoleophilaceae bacterium]|nr:ATP-binding protein [Thermoleophilaceae bacterium]